VRGADDPPPVARGMVVNACAQLDTPPSVSRSSQMSRRALCETSVVDAFRPAMRVNTATWSIDRSDERIHLNGDRATSQSGACFGRFKNRQISLRFRTRYENQKNEHRDRQDHEDQQHR